MAKFAPTKGHTTPSLELHSLTKTNTKCTLNPKDLLYLSATYAEKMLQQPNGKSAGRLNLIHRPGNPWADSKDTKRSICLFCGEVGCKHPYRSWKDFSWGSAAQLLDEVSRLSSAALIPDPWITLQIAIRLDGLTVLDCDPRHNGPATPEEAWAWLEDLGVSLPNSARDTLIVRTGGGGLHIYFSGATNFTWGDRKRNEAVSVLSGGGRQATAPFSYHSAGAFYLPVNWEGIPLLSPNDLLQVAGKIQPFPEEAFRSYTCPSRRDVQQESSLTPTASIPGRFSPPPTTPTSVLIDGVEIPGDWAERSRTLTDGRNNFLTRAKFAFVVNYRRDDKEANRLIRVLNGTFPDPLEEKELLESVLRPIPAEKIDPAQKKISGAPEISLGDLLRPSMDDAGNAERWILVSPDHLYVPSWGWVCWNGGVWERLPIDQPPTREYTQRVARSMQTIAREMVEHTQGDDDGRSEALQKYASGLGMEKSILKALNLARVRPRGETKYPSDFDNEHTAEILNTPNEIVNLRTGESLPHSAEYLVTKQTSVPREDGTPTLWTNCLNTWQPDKEVQHFLQMLVGSGLTGVPLDKFVINSGDGANGKSVFWGAVSRIMGSYAGILPEDLIIKNPHTDRERCVVEISGVRLAVASELANAAQMNESMVKLLTGGERLKARQLYRESFDVTPTGTMVLHTNAEPTVQGTDHGIWRRILYVLWDVQIPEGGQDKHLLQKLVSDEGGRILSWAVEGAKMFLENGSELVVPSCMELVKKDRQGAFDTTADFFQEYCVFDDDSSIGKGDLYKKYTEIMRRNLPIEPLVSKIALGKRLEAYAKANDFSVRDVRDKKKRMWQGVGIQAQNMQTASSPWQEQNTNAAPRPWQ